MVFDEKTVSTEEVFKGSIVTLAVDKVEMPDGSLARRELVYHPGGVGVVAITDQDEIIMVYQYRKAIEKAIYEIPAGKLDPGEEPNICGMRELEEETGLKARTFEYLGFIYPSPGFTDEVTHIYLATDLYQGQINPDPDEYLDVVKMPISNVLEKIMNNEISDAKTVAGVLKALRKINKKRHSILYKGESHGKQTCRSENQ